MSEQFNVGNPPLPGNSQYTYIVDTTKLGRQDIAAVAARTAPGTERGILSGARVFGTISPTGQSVTVTFLNLKDPQGSTSAAWAQDASGPDTGTKVIAAGDTYRYNWLPSTADWAIEILAGASAPTDIDYSTTVVTGDRSSGV